MAYFHLFCGFQVTLTSGTLQFDSLDHEQTTPSLLAVPPPPPPPPPPSVASPPPKEVEPMQQQVSCPSVQQQRPLLSIGTGECRGIILILLFAFIKKKKKKRKKI